MFFLVLPRSNGICLELVQFAVFALDAQIELCDNVKLASLGSDRLTHEKDKQDNHGNAHQYTHRIGYAITTG